MTNSIELFPRLCEATKKGISDGYLVGDDSYLSNCLEGDAQLLAESLLAGYMDLEDAFAHDFYYYTDWIEEYEDINSDTPSNDCDIAYDSEGNKFELIDNEWVKQ